MEEQHSEPMICATSVMKPGRARIGRITGNWNLPRTIPIINLVAVLVGTFLGLALAVALGPSGRSIAIGAALGGAAGWMAVTYSPLKNESLLKWFELKVRTHTRARYVNGRRVTLAVGTGVVAGPSSGQTLLLRSSIGVPAGQYDARGAIRSARNQNLTDDDAVDPALLWVGSAAPAQGAMALPVDAPAELTTRRSRRNRDLGVAHSEQASAPMGSHHLPAGQGGYDASWNGAVQAPPAMGSGFLDGPTQRLKD